MKKWLLAVVTTLIVPQALAGGYASIGYAFSNIEPEDRTSDADVDALQFSYGSWLNPEGTFGGEFRAALGISGDQLDSNGSELEIDRYFGAYMRGQFPDTLPVRPYGLLGFSRVETTLGNTSDDYNDLSLGIGADMTVAQNVFVSLEFLRLVDRSDAEVSNLTLSVGGRF